MKKNLQKNQVKSRKIWGFNPITRVKQSKKIYSRKNYITPFT